MYNITGFRLQWERRTLPEEPRAAPAQELNRVIQAVKNIRGGHRVTGRDLFSRCPHEIPKDSYIVKLLQRAPLKSELCGLTFCADSALFQAVGVPFVLFGPIDHMAHAIDEWVSLKSLIYVYHILKKTIMENENG